MEPSGSRFDIREYQRVLTRRWWQIAAVALCAGIIGVFISLGLPNTYTAVATIVVPESPRGVLMVGGQREAGQSIALATQGLIAAGNQTAQITAKSLAERTTGPPIIVDPSEITGALKTSVQLPDLLRIQATSEDEVKAKEFANETANSFLQVMDSLRQKQTTNATQYLQSQVENTRRDLEDLISQRQKLQREWGLRVEPGAPAAESPDVAAETAPLVSASTREPDSRPALRQAQTGLAAAQGRLRTLRSQFNGLSDQSPRDVQTPNPTYQSLQEQLTTSQVALVQLRSQYTQKHPAVQEMELRIQELRVAIAHTPPIVKTTVVPDATARGTLEGQVRAAEQNVADLTARVASLGGAVSAADARWSNALDKEGYLEQLQDQIGLKRSAYRELLLQLESKKLEVASQRGQASMVDSALSARSTAPSWPRTLIFSLALGLFLGIAMALLLEALDDTIRIPEDLTRDRDVRFLGIIPWTGEDPKIVMLEAPKSPPAEAFRTARSNIRFASVDEPAQVIMLTSAGASEGKSMVLANLAVAYAQAGESVLIVDGDLRRPTQHKLFELDPSLGLTNVLVGEATLAQALQPTAIPNLRVLCSGPLPPNPAELVDSPRMTQLLDEMRGMASVVLLDSPPAIMLTDALLLAGRVDATLLVAASTQVTGEAFDEMVRLLTNARGRILGVLLNKMRLTAGDYYYYYYYYYYGAATPGGRPEMTTTPTPAEMNGHSAPPPPGSDLPFAPPSDRQV